ncbi:MAG: hypothetical protein ABI640_13580 [Gammaproteobacteria bacterium]
MLRTRSPDQKTIPSARHTERRRLHLVVAATCVLAALAAAAQPPNRELLNSERIQQAFGSYGVEVLANEARTRVTNLYSVEADKKTCRTFAVVRFPAIMDAAVATEHATITNGGSIGATFAANGWRVRKTHLAFRELEATPRLAQLMHVPTGARLAADAYVLDVTREGKTVEYAALLEIHHPEYLKLADLERIYGAADAGSRQGLLDDLLTAAAAAADAAP